MFRWFMHVLLGASMAFGFTCYAAAARFSPAHGDVTLIQQQKQAFVEALKPQREGRPVVAVVALNEGTELTDLLLPHAVLKRADLTDVQIVAPRRGRVVLYPALEIDGAQDFASFDRSYPNGADYVIVPALRSDSVPAITAWLQRQAAQGARIIAVCSGARVAGRAGLLDGRQFTGHWYDRRTLLRRHPGATYVPQQRYIYDRGVVTSTGITASVPTMLALVEAIGGRDKARDLADDLGVVSWGPEHDSALFGLNVGRAWAYALNKAAFWLDERWRVDVQDGIDDIALALAADAWSRSGRVGVRATSDSSPVTLRSGLLLITEPADGDFTRLPLSPDLKPVQQLDRTLCEIARRYGDARRDWVMQEMEYSGVGSATQGSPGSALSC
ncbi:thiamine biosynthesis protein ThiJ [Candidimonas sp. SYP-B2681]|uniref:DJ-1/PfpI family protein n=1 Tax=Candidimonas sp. SYP-B2681 TaxID=2497686 RepID=UPI000F88FD0A|nr:DJ-1/PfpI family protein [Candidimonas sp. SYP-B2681]RTZ41571.1 thiamine biosynthesis protein ThiJ [Candidimonas sp. SYP-B2681]